MRPLEGRPVLSYPCSWTYRIICTDESELRHELAAILGESSHTLARIGDSSSGRYRRMELVVSVRDEAHRNQIFADLGRAAMVRFVL